jgi:hypothetical protein
MMILSAVLAAAAHAQAGIGTCVMGETGSASFGQYGLYHYGPLIYQWIDPATCGFCLVSDGAIVLRTVELEVFPALGQTVPVSLPAVVSVVGWKGAPACPEPDDAAILLPARSVTFTVPPDAVGRALVRVSIPDSPQFLQPAFLRLEFPSVPMPPQRPGAGAGPDRLPLHELPPVPGCAISAGTSRCLLGWFLQPVHRPGAWGLRGGHGGQDHLVGAGQSVLPVRVGSRGAIPEPAGNIPLPP